LKKLKSGFFEPWLKTLSSNTSGSTHNRLRTNFNQCFTRTGRLSSSKPLNLQNVPARGEIGKTLRSLFIPPPGYDLIIGDDSAIELRIMAEYFAKIAGDFSWIDIFKTDADLHTYNAKLLGFEEIFAASLNLNISDPIVQKAARDAAKTAAYGAAYGAGALKLGDGDKEKGKQIYDAILQKMPSLNLCKLLAQATVIHNKGTIWDLFGHLGYYDLSSIVFQKDAEKPKRQLFNFMIQSSSASRIKSRVLLAKPFLEKHRALIASCTHDEYMIYCPCDRAPQELAEKLTAVFSAPDSLSYCPVVFEFKVCKNWSDK
jgi:DNA polymerase-1